MPIAYAWRPVIASIGRTSAPVDAETWAPLSYTSGFVAMSRAPPRTKSVASCARRIDVVERPFAHDDKIDRRGGFREAAMHVLLAAAEADDATRWPSSSAFRARRRSISTKSLSTVMPLAISSALRAAPPRTKAVAPGVWLATKLAVAMALVKKSRHVTWMSNVAI